MSLSGDLVGRAAELRTLDECLRAAAGGQARIVLLAGEPGVGKTRLAERLLESADGLGLVTAIGRASEDEGSPPYWPFRQVFRALGIPMPTAEREDASARFALFEKARERLVDAAAATGLLVVLDDVQWADAATLRLLAHLAGGTDPARLMILATYRDTEGPRPELSALVRYPRVTRIRLDGLTEAEVATYLATITGWEVPASVASAVTRRTRGNPFFVGELGRILSSSVDGRLPDGVIDAVRDRLARLSPLGRDVVCEAAVLGSDVDSGALAVATGRSLADVLTATDEAEAAGILQRGRFAHDLIREAARLELPTVRRLELHDRFAADLAGRADSAERVAEIAQHRLEALPMGDPGDAAGWARRAGDRAMAQLAWEEAATWYDRAGQTTPEPGERARLLVALAQAHVRAFEVQAAQRCLLTAAEVARSVGDQETIARAALTIEGVSDYVWDRIGAALCAEALAALPDVDSPLRARLLALHVVLANEQPADVIEQESARALAMAERTGDRRALREALRSRQFARSGPDGAADRMALGARMLELGTETGDDDTAMWGRLWRHDAAVQLGDLDAAESELAELSTVVARLRSPLASWHLVRSRAALAAARGSLDQATELAAEAESIVRRGGTASTLMPTTGFRMLLRLEVGDLSEEPDVGQWSADSATAGFIKSTLVLWLLATDRRTEAYEIYRSLPALDRRPAFVALPGIAGMAELAAAFDDADTAADVYRRLLPYADLFVCGGAGVVFIKGSVRHWLGVAAATAGRLDDAARHLRDAIGIHERAGMPGFVAHSTYQLASVLARRRRPGDADEAAGLAASAAAMADRTGLRPLAALARALAAVGAPKDPLTRREREIAELVGRGLTNRQIAATAHISERTAETHVQHILDKLGFSTRAQIAAWATVRDMRTGSA